MYQRKRVLIIDDDEDARAFVEAVLTSTGWDTFTAESGPEGLEIAERETPDLIVLDVTMPGMDGFEVFQRLRTGFATQSIPVVMLTAINTADAEDQHDADTVATALNVGKPEGFVDKPVDADFLLYVIGGILG